MGEVFVLSGSSGRLGLSQGGKEDRKEGGDKGT